MNIPLFLSLSLVLRAQILSFLSPKLDSVNLLVQDGHPITTFKFNSFVLVGNTTSMSSPGSHLFRTSLPSNLGLIQCNGPNDIQTKIFPNVDHYGAVAWNRSIVVVHQNSTSHCNPPQALCWTPVEFSVFNKKDLTLSSTTIIAPNQIIAVVRGVAATPNTIYILFSVVHREHMQLKGFSFDRDGQLLTYNILEYVLNVTSFKFIEDTAYIVGYTKFHMKELVFANTTYPKLHNATKFMITIGSFTDDTTWKIQFNPENIKTTELSEYHITVKRQQDFSVGLLHAKTSVEPTTGATPNDQPETDAFSWAWGWVAIAVVFLVIILLSRAYCAKICSNILKSRLNEVDSITRRDREDTFA